MQPTIANPRQEQRVRTETALPCTHSRMVDDVLGTNGVKTGRLVCKECLAEFPDPSYQETSQ